MADYGFTSHLLTIPVVLESVTPVSAEIQSVLGYDDKGVLQPAQNIGKTVSINPVQRDNSGILSVRIYTGAANEIPIGVIATKVKYDSNLEAFRTDIKLFGIIMEAYSPTATGIVTGARVAFGAAPTTNSDEYVQFQLPLIVTDAAGAMRVISVRNPVANMYIATIFVPGFDILPRSVVTAREGDSK